MRDAYPDRIEDNILIINVKFRFHHDKISETKNRQIIEEVISEVFGKKLQIVCRIADNKNRIKAVKKGENRDLEKTAEEVFEVE